MKIIEVITDWQGPRRLVGRAFVRLGYLLAGDALIVRARDWPPLDNQNADSGVPLANELGRVVTNFGEAKLIVARAGLNLGRCPPFDKPIVFWHAIVELARNGATAGGLEALTDAVAEYYPSNKIFARCRTPP